MNTSRRHNWFRFDLMTLLPGLVAGMLPACILVVISHLYLSSLDPELLASVQKPQLEFGRQRGEALAEVTVRRAQSLASDFRRRVLTHSTLPAADDDADVTALDVTALWGEVERIDWFLGDVASTWTSTSATLDSGFESRGHSLLESLNDGDPADRETKLAPLKELPITESDPLGFSFRIEAVLWSSAPHPEALALEVLNNARSLDWATLRAYLRSCDGKLELANLPQPIHVSSGVAPVAPGRVDVDAETHERLLVGVAGPGGGTLALTVRLTPLLENALHDLEGRAPTPEGYRVRLERAPNAVDREAAPWVRWPLPSPFDRDWELWVEHDGDSQTLVLDLMQRLGSLHYVYGALLLLALLTVASILMAGFFSKRVRLSRQKDDFVRLVSHELRTPITAIQMIAETLSLGRVRSEDERNEFLTQLEDESRRLTDLIERVLEYGQSAGERELVTDPEELVTTAVERFREQQRSAVELEVRVAQEFHPVLLDREAVVGVIYNLLSNARKYSPSDLPIEITVGEESRHLFIEVHDHGPGIKRSEQARIFKPFYRGSGSAISSGFGLGLAYCREVARNHGGRMTVDSAPGKGSRFTLEIPLLRKDTGG